MKNAPGQHADKDTIHHKAHQTGVAAARAALESVQPTEPTLEDVLGDDLYVSIAMQQSPGRCFATVESFEHLDIQDRTGHGTGATIEEAIRAAVRAATDGK